MSYVYVVNNKIKFMEDMRLISSDSPAAILILLHTNVDNRTF